MWSRLFGERYEGEKPSTETLMRLVNHPRTDDISEGRYINETYVFFYVDGRCAVFNTKKNKFVFCTRYKQTLDAYRFLINGAWGLW